MNAQLHVRLVGKRGDFSVDAAFSAGSGITGLFGPSGSGKTSILRAIAGLWAPGSGEVRLGDVVLFDGVGVNMPVHQRQIGCVFQEPVLFPHMTVHSNLRYGWREGAVDYEELVDLLDLRHLQTRRPQHLSGGEAQRVALARALLSQPRLLLLDEPLTGLDRPLREAIYPYLKQLPDLVDIPILYVTHSEDEMQHLAKRVLIIDNGCIISDMSVAQFLKRGEAGHD